MSDLVSGDALPPLVPCRRAAAGVGPVDGAGTLRSRPVGGMRQVRWIGSDQPRISALRVGSPTDARDAPLQRPPPAAPLRPAPGSTRARRIPRPVHRLRQTRRQVTSLNAEDTDRRTVGGTAGEVPGSAPLGAGRWTRPLGNRGGAPTPAAGPGCFSGSAAFARPIASVRFPAPRQGADPGRSPARAPRSTDDLAKRRPGVAEGGTVCGYAVTTPS